MNKLILITVWDRLYFSLLLTSGYRGLCGEILTTSIKRLSTLIGLPTSQTSIDVIAVPQIIAAYNYSIGF